MKRTLPQISQALSDIRGRGLPLGVDIRYTPGSLDTPLAAVVSADGVDLALARCADLVLRRGVRESTRVGGVLTVPCPVMVVMTNPRDRWLSLSGRNSNPFYFLADTAWVLNQQNDLASLTKYLPRIGEYSDDGETLDGMAYGHRLKGQLEQLYHLAESDNIRGNRRVVVTMYHSHDIFGDGNSIPCNTQLMFREVGGALNLYVTNRSNDLVWGALGANSVCFSYIQEAVAHLAGLEVGTYTLFTKDLHVYDHHLDLLLDNHARWLTYATHREAAPVPDRPMALGPTYGADVDPFLTAAQTWGWVREGNCEWADVPGYLLDRLPDHPHVRSALTDYALRRAAEAKQ